MIRHLTSVFTCILLCACLLLGSCKVYHPVSSARANYSPSVTLKTGKKITGAEVRSRTPMIGKDKIEIDDKKYLAKDVAFYETSRERFANIGGATFAEQFIAGKINIYTSTVNFQTSSYSSTGGMSTHQHSKVTHYIQKGDEAPVVLMNNKVVKDYVRPYKPSLQLLQKSDADSRYKKLAIIGGSVVAAAGLAVLIGGAGKWVSDASGDTKPTFFFAGFGLITAGVLGIYVPLGIFKFRSQQHTWEAIDAYNRQ